MSAHELYANKAIYSTNFPVTLEENNFSLKMDDFFTLWLSLNAAK